MSIHFRKKEASIVLFLFLSLFVSLLLINTEISGANSEKNEAINENNNRESHLEESGFWNLTESPIVIDDYQPNCNWKKTASKHEWCFGSGTLDDPYIIENVIINGQESTSCITIRNSNVYFIIRNCILYNSGWSLFNWDSGIKLINTNNGNILNNNCSYNNGFGILQIGCSNNNFSGNIVNHNSHHGIYSWSIDKINIFENEINYNQITGIYFWFSYKNNISDNIINSNQNGIYLIMSSNNFITSNYLVDNNVSIYQFWSGGNFISENKYEYDLPPPAIPDENAKIDGDDNDDDDDDTEEIEAKEIPYISLILIGTSIGFVSGGIIGYLIQKKRIEKKSLFLFSKPMKEKSKAESSLNLEEKVVPEPELEFVPKGAIMKFGDMKKLIEEQEDLKKNENEKK